VESRCRTWTFIPFVIESASTDPITTAKETKADGFGPKFNRDESQDAIVWRKICYRVTSADLTIAADKSEAEWTLDVTANTTPGPIRLGTR